MSHFNRGIVGLLLVATATFVSPAQHADAKTQQTNVDQAQHMTDGRGIPQLSIDGVGKVAHPAWTALYALAYAGVEDYDPSLGLKPDPQRFAASIVWLKENLVQDKNGLWIWPYTFDSTYNDVAIKAPWSSAFAQATGIQALLVHWKQTGDQSSLQAATKAARALFVPLSEGGFLFARGDDAWFEEIPQPVDNPSHILNGHMRVLLALHALADATGDKQYQQWFSKGTDTLLRWLPRYDAGYWLRYDLNPRKDELLFRLANPYGFSNPTVAIDKITLRDPLSGAESVLDVGRTTDAEGDNRIAGNDWGQVEQIGSRSVRRLQPVMGAREAPDSSGQMVAPFTYFYLKLPGQWRDNLRDQRYELTVDYFDEKPGNLDIQMRSISPQSTSFRALRDGALLLSGSAQWRQWKVAVQPRDLGYWVGKTYGAKHAQYLDQLAKVDGRLDAWRDISRAYLNTLPGAGYATVEPKAEQVPDQTPILPWYSMDKNGVLLMHIKDKDGDPDTGKAVYSPFIVALQAAEGSKMAGLQTILRKFNIDKERVKKAPAVQWLLDPRHQYKVGDATTYKFEFRNVYNDVETASPWQSSFAQTYVLKVLQSVYQEKAADAQALRALLNSTLQAYAVDVADGGLAHKVRLGGLFFEEVPNRTHVLNAQLSALPMIKQVSAIDRSSLGDTLVQQGVEALKNSIGQYDTGYWMRYDANPKKELLFQIDWIEGDTSPLIERIALQAPQFAKQVSLEVGSEKAFVGGSRITGLEWASVQVADGRQVRAFANGYAQHKEAVQGGARHNAFVLMQLPQKTFTDYLDIQPHRLVVHYKDVAAGRFAVKVQSINEGNVLDFTPLPNAVITTVGDQQWKDAVIEVRPQDMGWYKGADYQVFEVDQLEHIGKLTKDWFFNQYAERQRYYLEAKGAGRTVIDQPVYKAPFSAVDVSVMGASKTYDGFGFENALDGDPNNNYVAGVENQPVEFVDLKLARAVSRGTLHLKWENKLNYAGHVRVLALAGDGTVQHELAAQRPETGQDLEVKFASEQPVEAVRLEFSEFVGQPRLLARLIEVQAEATEKPSPAKVVTQPRQASAEVNGNLLDGHDPRNPLSVFRIPVTLKIKALSHELVADAHTEHEKILAFMHYIDGFSVGYARSLSPDDTVAERKGACGSFTNTLLALAAAQGMEGRVVSLLNYPKNDGHAVAEIKVDGHWQLYDPTYGAFYTRAGSERPLSFEALKAAYTAGEEVDIHHESSRAGAEAYLGKDIYTKAAPAGVLGADRPFYFPLQLSLSEKNRLEANEFGPKWQGASFIGAADTNQQQDWTLGGVTPGKRYQFEVVAQALGGELKGSDRAFRLIAVIKDAKGGEHTVSHVFDFTDGQPKTWKIPFVAYSEQQTISLRHEYVGPDYRYLRMQSYALVE
ncbi:MULTISPECIES: D-glucuronyl C5-epimerase family protein [Pseudomonas]|uniref:Transglutaminase-like domain-containing protein n=1 Tax=Pseudomonas mosselii TaxID=78327 RepID=A0A5R8Z695_9PSED|nr:D-glucuronyl C5-epimerase family protein [Pseudomonas mosselii]TLP61141.1 hypothetical protein FEM01_11160 [Pseudomonas mosselii]